MVFPVHLSKPLCFHNGREYSSLEEKCNHSSLWIMKSDNFSPMNCHLAVWHTQAHGWLVYKIRRNDSKICIAIFQAAFLWGLPVCHNEINSRGRAGSNPSWEEGGQLVAGPQLESLRFPPANQDADPSLSGCWPFHSVILMTLSGFVLVMEINDLHFSLWRLWERERNWNSKWKFVGNN